MSVDVLTRVCAEIDARLLELRPALAEYQRLLDAEQALATEAEQPRATAAKPARTAAAKQKPQRAPKRPRAVRAPAVSSPRRGRRGSAAGALERAASTPRGASQQAIVAALEHGSHTLGELAVVTAISSSKIRESVRQLQRGGAIARTRREGRVAYALSSPAAG
jgi:hypothetical protein